MTLSDEAYRTAITVAMEAIETRFSDIETRLYDLDRQFRDLKAKIECTDSDRGDPAH
jgi:hypothetical protein